MEKPKREVAIERIARAILGIETLESRSSDRLDFYELGVWTLKTALEEAYEAGRKEAESRG